MRIRGPSPEMVLSSVIPTAAQIRETVCHTLTVFLLATLPAWAAIEDSDTARNYFEDAAQRFDSGDLEGAIIQLKNALSENLENISARILLGRVYLQAGYAVSAEKELRIALGLGADEDEVLGTLGNALLVQRKYRELLDVLRADDPTRKITYDVALLRARAYLELGELDEAERSFSRAFELRANRVDPLLGRAQVAYSRAEYEKANTLLTQALEMSPQNAEVHFQLGELSSAQIELAAAREHYLAALALDEDHVRARVAHARVAYDLGDYAAALKDSAQVHEAHPRDPIAAFIRGQAAARLGDLKQAQAAIASAKESVTSLPDDMLRKDPARLQVAGLVHYLGGEPERAVYYLTEFLRLRPNHHPLRRLLGLLLLNIGDAQGAITQLYPLKRIYGDDAELLAALGDALTKAGRYVEASNVLEEAVDVAPDAASLQTRLAISHIGAGQQDLGVAELERAVAMGRDKRRSGMLLTLVQLRREDFEGALETAGLLVERYPDNPAASNLLGAVQLKSGDKAGARKSLDKALELQPGYAPALHNLAKLAFDNGDIEGARARYKELLESDPRDSEALIGMADIALSQGDNATAIEWLERSAGSKDGGLSAQLRLIGLYLEKQNETEALHVVSRLVQKFPEDPDVAVAQAQVHSAMGRTDRARVSFRRAARLSGFSGDRLMSIARGQTQVQDYEGARYTLHKATRTYVGEYAYKALIRLEILTKNFDKAELLIGECRESYPDSAMPLIMHAELLKARGFIDQAISTLEKSKEEHESNPEVVIKLAELLAGVGRISESLELLESRTAQYPDEFPARRTLAIAYVANGMHDKARSLHEQLVAEAPNDTLLVANLARIYQLAGDSRARALAERAVALNAEWSVALDTLGWILVNEGDAEAGLRYLRQAIARNANALTRYHLAIALKEMGRLSEARSELGRILSTEPSLEWLKDVKQAYDELEAPRS